MPWHDDEFQRVWHDRDVHPDDVMLARIGSAKARWDILAQFPEHDREGRIREGYFYYAITFWCTKYSERSDWDLKRPGRWAYINDLLKVEIL